MNAQIDLEGRVSAAAKRARGKYELVHGEGMTGYAVANWREAVKPFFAEFIKAVRNAARPVPAEYFDVGTAFPENPIFAFPYSKAIHCILCDLGRMSPADLDRLVKEVVEPYMGKWEELLAALETRFGQHDRLVAFRSRLSALFDKIYSLRFGRPGMEFFDGYNAAYTEFRNGFRELAAAMMAPAAKATAEKQRRRYPKDAEAMAILREGLRRKGEAKYRNMSDREIMAGLTGDPYYYKRMTKGKRVGEHWEREANPISRDRAAVQWGKYLSEYGKAHGPVNP